MRRAALALAVLVMGAICALRLDVVSDVMRFLPDRGEALRAVLSRELLASDLTRNMVISLDAGSREATREAVAALETRLREHPDVTWLRAGVDPDQLRELYELYFPRRHYFLSDAPEALPGTLLSPEGLRARAAALRRELALPSATLLEEVATRDPLGAFPRVIQRVRGSRQAGLRVEDGRFWSQDGDFGILLLGTRASGFDSRAQGRLLDDLEAARAELREAHGPALRFEMSGANRFAVSAERSIRGDIVRIAALSFLGITLVFLVLARSPLQFLLALLPPALGVLFAATLGALLQGSLEGLTLAFGMALCGVSIDYSIHVLNHHGLHGGGRPAHETARRLRPSLVLGAATTLASFAGLAITSFPGLRELGLFAMAGVGGALLVTLFVLPDLLPVGRPPSRHAARTAATLGRIVDRMARHPRALGLATALLVSVSLLALPRITWVDDLSRLADIDPALVEEDRRVRSRVSSLDGSRFVIALGDDAQAALARNDAVHERLSAAVGEGALGGMRSLHALLWSRSLQERNLAALRSVPDLPERVDAAFVAEGFRPGAFAPFARDLAQEPPPPLLPEDLRRSGFDGLLRASLLDLGHRFAAITYLRELREPAAVAAALEPVEGAWLFDQGDFASALYAEFREATLRQILVGSLLVVAVLWLRYRALRPAAAAFLPSLVVALLLLAGFAVAGAAMNLLHVVCLIMVMGMGVDYGIFLVDSAHDRRRFEATLLSLLLSCLTTVLVFGTLAFSSHPALRAIGLTTGGGILLSFLFAPLCFALVARAPETDDV